MEKEFCKVTGYNIQIRAKIGVNAKSNTDALKEAVKELEKFGENTPIWDIELYVSGR